MKALANHKPSFTSAPLSEKGDTVSFVRLDPKNRDWFIGIDVRGVEGYFPVRWFQIDDQEKVAVAQRNYNAAELSVSVGDPLELEEEYGEWILVSVDGRIGWIPQSCSITSERVEQINADQSATAMVLISGGNEKPKPESEDGSQ